MRPHYRGFNPILAKALILAGCLFALGGTTTGKALENGEVRLARLTPPDAEAGRIGSLPEALATADAGRYRLIFELQEEGRFKEADRLIARLQNRLLLGHVLAQRYLHPTAYRSRFDELADWLEHYADLPQAYRIRRLAMRRRPAKAKMPAEIVDGYLAGYGQELIAPDKIAAARVLLDRGILDWQAHRFNAAARNFAKLASDTDMSSEDRAAGAFWAARSRMLAGRPDLVRLHLRQAASVSDEFYGLLAKELLGEPIRFDWYEESLKEETAELLLRFPSAQRAIALAEVGQEKLAEAEIRKLAARAKPELAYALAALAEALHIPAAQMRVAQRLRLLDGRRHDGALYPLPAWQPQGGFRVDPALIYAIIRAESAFDMEAQSPSNARGLMQVTPGTARYLSRKAKFAYDGEDSLYDPVINLTLGQALIRVLADEDSVNTSLIHILASYNAGAARVSRWCENELGLMEEDPLLFIEALPSTETRSYVKKVLANLWAYHARLGRQSPSLRALAENRWPEMVLSLH